MVVGCRANQTDRPTTTIINKTCLSVSGTVAAGRPATPVYWQRQQRWWLTFSPLLLCTAAVCASAPPPAPAEAN